MLKRRMFQVLTGIAVAAAALFGVAGTAGASPSGFTAAFVHAGGTGAVGAEAIGGITWYNRSVSLTNVQIYAHASECARLDVSAYANGTRVDSYTSIEYCTGSASRWFPAIPSIPLDGSAVSGGITEVLIRVVDVNDTGYGYADCFRSGTACSRF